VPEVAFHFNAPDKLQYTCRLLRKAVGSGATVTVLGSAALINALDQLLWSFSNVDFLPHCEGSAPANVAKRTPIVLLSSLDTVDKGDLLVNLGTTVPQEMDRFVRIVEIVGSEPDDKQHARQRWKHYLDLGIGLIRHDLGQRAAI